jgi:hypothetical protein
MFSPMVSTFVLHELLHRLAAHAQREQRVEVSRSLVD